MENVARRLVSSDATHEVGSITRIDGARCFVATDAGAMTAARAPSCLVAPEVGDLVLVTALPAGACFVVAVLEREAGATASITAEGDMAIRLPHGRLSLAAEGGVEISAPKKDLTIVANTLEVDAVKAHVGVDRLDLVSTFVRAEFERAKTVAASLESALGRVFERATRVYRKVDEIEQVRAERLSMEATTTLSLHGENTLVTAEELVKVDGAQIHLG
jgi:hypothetical protein